MSHLKSAILTLAAALLATAAFTADAQQQYRWIDADGVVRIADRIPPDAAHKRIEVLNARGMVVRVIEPQKSGEELAEELRERELEAQAVAARQEQARRDRVLLDSYTTVGDLVRSRDGHLATLDGRINMSREALANLEGTIADLEQRIASFEAREQAPPEALVTQLEDARANRDSTARFIEAREQEQADIRARFEADIARFQELRSRR